MANARTRYDTICDYLVRSHGAQPGRLFGKPCLLLRQRPFIAWAGESMGFRLSGRQRLQALALPGARFWDPMDREQPVFGWIALPSEQFLRWDRYAIEAARQAEHDTGDDFTPRAEAAPGPDSRPELRAVRPLKPTGVLSRLWSLVPLGARDAAARGHS